MNPWHFGCFGLAGSQLVSVTWRVALVLLVLSLLVGRRSIGSAAPEQLAAPKPVVLSFGNSGQRVIDSEDDGSVDLYGNSVTDAVAKYELDGTGSLYELHSPQTELPRLAPPKS
jgi:hypothetical protein